MIVCVCVWGGGGQWARARRQWVRAARPTLPSAPACKLPIGLRNLVAGEEGCRPRSYPLLQRVLPPAARRRNATKP